MSYTVQFDADNNAWSEFILSHPKGNIFQSPEMYEVYLETKNHEPLLLVAIDDSSNIHGVLLAVIQKEHSGPLGKLSSRSIIIGGPVVKDDNLEILSLLLKIYLDQIRNKAIYTQVRNLFDQSSLKAAFLENGFNYEPHLNILINLDLPEQDIIQQVHKGKRRNVTKSINKGTDFIEIDRLDEFTDQLGLIYSTYNRIGIPIPDTSLFLSAFRKLYPKGLLHAFSVKTGSKTIGIRIELTYKGILYDWYAGSDEGEKNKYPNDLLPYNIILWGHANGYKLFDFGGAGKPDEEYGVRDHKLKFGGELVEFGRFELIHNRILFRIANIGLKFYKFLF